MKSFTKLSLFLVCFCDYSDESLGFMKAENFVGKWIKTTVQRSPISWSYALFKIVFWCLFRVTSSELCHHQFLIRGAEARKTLEENWMNMRSWNRFICLYQRRGGGRWCKILFGCLQEYAKIILCKVWGFHINENSDKYLQGYDNI